MKQRKWDNKTKAKIVLEGLKGGSIADICNAHQICQSQYYQWRDQFLNHIEMPFEAPKKPSREHRLERQVKDLRYLVGALTMELKKNEDELL